MVAVAADISEVFAVDVDLVPQLVSNPEGQGSGRRANGTAAARVAELSADGDRLMESEYRT